MKREPTLSQKLEKRRRAAKWLRVVLIVSGVLTAAFAFASMMIWPPINAVTTGETSEYPDLMPAPYDRPAREMFLESIDTLEGLPRAEIVSSSAERLRVDAELRSILGTSRFEVWVEPNGEAGAIVFASSRSSGSRGDFGQNARHIRRFYEALATEVGADTPP